MKMIRLRKNEPVRYNGVQYDFTGMDQHKLQNIYDNHPLLRHLFEFVVEEVIEEVVEFVEDKLQDFFDRNKPEDKTEEQFLKQTLKEINPIRKRIKRK
jgi:hypothetical protein